MKNGMMLLFVCVFISNFIFAQDEDYIPRSRNFHNYYLSPLKVSRDHPLHASLFQIPLLSARSLANDTGVLGASFEYTSIESDFKNGDFSYDFEGGLYRMNFDLDFSLRDNLDLIVHYEVAGVDGDQFSALNVSNIINPSIKKSGSGNIDVIARQKVYTFEEQDIDLGLVIGCSVPIVSTKTLAVSKNFDFGGGLLLTRQRDLYAIHLNVGFVYVKDSTAFIESAEYNHSVYGGLSIVGKITNHIYGIAQLSILNPAMKEELSPGDPVIDGTIGGRYIYDAYVMEAWVGHGYGDASHGVNIGLSIALCF